MSESPTTNQHTTELPPDLAHQVWVDPVAYLEGFGIESHLIGQRLPVAA